MRTESPVLEVQAPGAGEAAEELPPERVLEPTRGWRLLKAREIWASRELLYFLTWRDVKVRYKQTLFGGLWAIMQPFLLMVVFTFVFGQFAGVETNGLPYPIFAFAALVPWTLFSSSFSGAASSLVAHQNLISKIYFPRIIIPLAASGSFILDFVIAMGVLFAMMFYYDITPTLDALWVIPLSLLALTAALSAGILLAALNVRYRDVRYVVPFFVQLLLFASPIGYSTGDRLSGFWRVLYGLNPMTGVAEGFRWALLGSERPGTLILVSSVAVVTLFVTALLYFRRMERTFADVI